MTVRLAAKKEGNSRGWIIEKNGKEATLLSIRKQLAWESHAGILKCDRQFNAAARIVELFFA